MELLLGQTEQYVEYDRSGRVIKGVEKVVPKSHYPEDIHHKNHREIWGSYWEEGCWGYACCHSTVYNSYCLGQVPYALQDFSWGPRKYCNKTDWHSVQVE
ncbi:hypothetical protein Zmor_028526 [Zophobas morio]|uniref:Pre-mRNA-splicing factor SLU7 n=1 Tax=Zophobas morio TaxID=2755281 RepID=A0AA38HJ72_9CUCU|nr:hypothetical protein Zmor_028526 [Zophobas morio]